MAKREGSALLATGYRVPAAQALLDTGGPRSDDRAADADRYCAVFVAHGMGQQRPYETLDQVAEGLLAAGSAGGAAPAARTVSVGGQQLGRLELELQTPGRETRKVHVYEGYWAPLVEGEVTLRDTVRFLLDGAKNGLTHAGSGFGRWIWGAEQRFPIPARTSIYLLAACLVVFGLTVLNAIIAAAAARWAGLPVTASWMSDHKLVLELTTHFNLLLLCLGALGLCLWLAHMIRKVARRWVLLPVQIICRVFFVLSLWMIPLTGIAAAFLIYAGWRHVAVCETAVIFWSCPSWLDEGRLQLLNSRVEIVLALAVLAVAAIAAVRWILRTLATLARETRRPFGLQSWLVAVLFALLGAGIVVQIGFWLPSIWSAGDLAYESLAVSWVLLVVASGFARTFLIQYVGDVAVYVTPDQLDRFDQLRKRVKDCVYAAAHGVYSATKADGSWQYESILVVGHSLGSVIVYDTLNRLLLEDELARSPDGARGGLRDLRTGDRTALLLTFGSPLDKTAYLFAVHGKQTQETHDALLASAQPLLSQERPFPWINLYSPADIISGYLKFYDPPDPVEVTPDPVRIDALLSKYKKVAIWTAGRGYEVVSAAEALPDGAEQVSGRQLAGARMTLVVLGAPARFGAAFLRRAVQLIVRGARPRQAPQPPGQQAKPEPSEEPRCRLAPWSEVPLVQNWQDRQASTLLAAHGEYWDNPLLYRVLLGQLR